MMSMLCWLVLGQLQLQVMHVGVLTCYVVADQQQIAALASSLSPLPEKL